MSRYDDGDWPAYVPVAERRRKAEREVARLRKKGHSVAPVRIEGRAIAATAWGKAWCDNLESYRDYESRLPRGRTYVRNGSVIDLQVGRCEVEALVSGSSIYKVTVGIAAMPAAQWRSICADCAGRIESLVELLQGRLSKGVMERMCRQGTGLFPKPSEIRFSCSCLDHASMCKHVAAVLYGVGARLDESPDQLFRLRAVDAGDLMAGRQCGAGAEAYWGQGSWGRGRFCPVRPRPGEIRRSGRRRAEASIQPRSARHPFPAEARPRPESPLAAEDGNTGGCVGPEGCFRQGGKGSAHSAEVQGVSASPGANRSAAGPAAHASAWHRDVDDGLGPNQEAHRCPA